jgi:hypothetical protein
MAKARNDPPHFLTVAQRHLERVKDASDPPDWSDLGTYGLYCLEALIRAAAIKAGETPIRTHWGKADQARNLAKLHKLPDVSKLVEELNVLRKSFAYGDSEVDESNYDPKDIADQIEDYFNKVSEFCKR